LEIHVKIFSSLLTLVVGKSNILIRFVNNKFKADHEATIGVEFGAKNVATPNKKVFRIQIWDTVNTPN
jgi:Ras-related protein Rab-2A